MLVQAGLARHVAQSDASTLNQVQVALLRGVEQVDQRLDLASLHLRNLGEVALALLLQRPHEVFVGAEVRKGNGAVLYGVLVEHAVCLDGPEEVGSDFILYEGVSVAAVEAEVSEESAALAVVFDVLGVFEHVHHEFYGVLGSY